MFLRNVEKTVTENVSIFKIRSVPVIYLQGREYVDQKYICLVDWRATSRTSDDHV
jgi:hypothetical protein